jgi:RNA polymerase sigma-70 factor, ECF subfamily
MTRDLDDEIVERAARGDRGAMEALLQRHFDFVRRRLYRFLGPDRDLDDLVQTVLVKIVSSLPSARLNGPVQGWIAGICVHVARDHLRRRRVRRIVASEAEGGYDVEQHPAAGDMEGRIRARARLDLLFRALDTLSPEQRLAFVLHHIDGHAVAEVAKLMDAALSTTRLRLYFGKKKIVAALEDATGDAMALPKTEET